MKRHISITLWTCSAIEEIKNNSVKLCSICLLYSGRHYIPLHSFRVSQWVIHLVNLCYVGGMKRSMAENNGWEQVTKVVYMQRTVNMTLSATEKQEARFCSASKKTLFGNGNSYLMHSVRLRFRCPPLSWQTEPVLFFISSLLLT